MGSQDTSPTGARRSTRTAHFSHNLQRDLHANDFTLCQEYTFGTQALFFAFLLLSEFVALRLSLEVSLPRCFTLQLSVSVSRR